MDHDRAARRYFQIREIERALSLTEEETLKAESERKEVEDRISELRATKRALQKDMRDAARDEGQLPLIDMMEALGNAHGPKVAQ